MKSIMGDVIQIDENNYIGSIRSLLDTLDTFVRSEMDCFWENEQAGKDNYYLEYASMLLQYMIDLNTWAIDKKMDIENTYIALDISDTRGFMRKHLIDWEGINE